ncbi:NUDIX domain-containing protein [Leptospira sp. GIMC2001]|uniref:NUDIX domain-containing protein n=1 Tax=Leptospira sp. GIMC2001 TaxID=1513297 RepID=UPI00234A0F69|nr:NUDIX hydrolase [Leptospira sp. GIMC2001]WCL48710.1 NUDIX hydrolase [Leptospira sp. GIMC2001]
MNTYFFKKKGLRVRVAGLIQNSKGEILFIQQSKRGKGPGYWLLPGGGVEFGESAEQALKRELLEELGLESIGMEFIAFNESIDPKGERHLIQLVFLTKVKDSIPVVDSREKAITGFGYFSSRDLVGMDIRPDIKDFLKKKKFIASAYIKSKWVEEQ